MKKYVDWDFCEPMFFANWASRMLEMYGAGASEIFDHLASGDIRFYSASYITRNGSTAYVVMASWEGSNDPMVLALDDMVSLLGFVFALGWRLTRAEENPYSQYYRRTK